MRNFYLADNKYVILYMEADLLKKYIDSYSKLARPLLCSEKKFQKNFQKILQYICKTKLV